MMPSRRLFAYGKQTYQSTSKLVVQHRNQLSRGYRVRKMAKSVLTPATKQGMLVGSSSFLVGSYLIRQYNVANAQEKPNAASRIDEDRYTASAVVSEIVNKMEGKSLKDLDITIYQYQVCPFCCKVRAFLDYHNIPYTIVEVNPMTKAEIKSLDTPYKKVPVVICNGVQLNDSSVIVTTLAQVLAKINGTDYPFEKSEESWRRYVDEVFVRRIPPNIYRSFSEAMKSFEYISEKNEFSLGQKYFSIYGGSLVMWGVSKKLKQKYEIEDERQAIYNCANDWTTALGEKHYMGGSAPNLADLAVYGILSSIEGLDTFNDLCHETQIGEYYYRMKDVVGECSGTHKIN
mmetsp:Transcript_14295/g.21606  ORF Transcript_14295/g.21606 Transcript_14295/m.21606 type:complete len:345 (-) Transcript_14295:34-1068(-)